MADIWNELVAAKVDVVLSGHNHVYERFDFIGHTDPPRDTGQDPDSIIETPKVDPQGIQQFVVGTGAGIISASKSPRWSAKSCAMTQASAPCR